MSFPRTTTSRTPSRNDRSANVRRAGSVLVMLAMSMTACMNGLEESSSESSTSSISRTDIMTRGKSWIDEKVPYSQSATHTNQFGTYRTDCSGYVSMAWGLSTSLTTFSLPNVSKPISAADLKAGDALLKNADGTNHVALFVRWAGNGRPVVWEEYTDGRPAEERTWGGLQGYEPRRYNQADGAAPGEGTSCPNGKGTTVGEIDKKYVALGGCGSILGVPISDEQTTPDGIGRFSVFERGSIYWTPNTGAHEVHGLIRDQWKELGWETSEGKLGYPITDETTPPDGVGRYNVFERGSIYWSPNTGAHEVLGVIRDKYKELGWEAGSLGYPTSGEQDVPEGKKSDFEHGSITWNKTTGETTVVGGTKTGTTGCTTVAHIGDSLTAYTTEPLNDAYSAVSIKAQIDAYGGRAILQRLDADPKTGKQAALDLVANGHKGCWVVALGTNDTANSAADTTLSRAKAIDAMMKAIDPNGNATVMWVNTFTTKTDGYWSNANMKIWNKELDSARGRWPNMRVFDWASIAATGKAPFTDGIHHTTEGFKVRNAAIAKAVSEL